MNITCVFNTLHYSARRCFFVEVPVDVLLHEQVEAIVKVAPHVRVEMDPADALWVGGSSHSVQFGQKTAPAVHHYISEIFL